MPTLKPGIDYVHAYQSQYGISSRLANEYAALPATAGAGINSKASAYGLAIKSVCSDGQSSTYTTYNGKLSLFNDVGSMVIPGTTYFLPGTYYAALQQINDGGVASSWHTQEFTKLQVLFSLLGWSYNGPGAE